MDVRCRIELLGRLRVQQGDREITRFRTQKTGALLGYLAYYTDRAHSREVLTDLLWPESAPAAGRQNLSKAVSSLRHQLGPPGMARGAIVRADRFTVRLNPATVATDVAEFEAAQQAAAEAGGDTERAEFLAEAIGLYGGELLPGYYQDWIIPEQRRLAELYFRTIRWLTAYLEQAGEWGRALECARGGVAADPLREEAHQDLIRLLAASGQAPEALRQYEALERILKGELDATPSAATRELARQIELRAEERGPVAVPGPLPAPVSPLPTGTVTFLMTEIEGTRSLQEQAPEAFPEALESYNVVFREAFRGHGGQEVKEAQGAFTVAFAHPSEALACAMECQKELTSQSWPEEVGTLRVRMALHTREVKPKEDESPGWLLRRGTQLLLVAYGGQILCSESSAVLLRRSLPAGTELTDLGYYRLRGTEEPERLFAVKYPGMVPEAFPPPRAAPAYTSNLPIQLTAFFGREEELARLEEMLLEENRRLLTLTGLGGSGKTRLALEAAGHVSEAFRGAVWSVELQELSDAGLIVASVLGALGLPRLPDVEPLAQLETVLSRQRSLLVLDNFEHLAEEGAQVAHELLERIPTLTCLVTSRRRLDLTGEREFFVAPLPVPSGDETPEGLMHFASVQLFVDRAQAVRPDFQVTEGNAKSLAELCYRLEGIPLALELAAARAQVMTPAQMVAELEHRFDFLVSRKRDVERRHRTLRAAMDWSYRLLSPDLQRFFAGLSVFRGGWTVEATEAVCQEPGALGYLEELRECSLILAEESAEEAGGMRFRMLETLREYAREQLSPEGQTALSRRHAEYCTALAEQGEPKLRTPECKTWLERLEREHDNFRAALEWCKSAEGDAETGLCLARALAFFWEVRGYLTEGRRHLAEVLALKGAQGRTAARAKALKGAACLATWQADYRPADGLFEESLAIWRELGDTQGIADCCVGMANAACNEGDSAMARTLLQQAQDLYEGLGSETRHPDMLYLPGVVAYGEGSRLQARALHQEHLAECRAREDPYATYRNLRCLAQLAREDGDCATARTHAEEALRVARDVGYKMGVQTAFASLARTASFEGDYGLARSLCEERLGIVEELGFKTDIGRCQIELATALAHVGEHGEARSLLKHTLPMCWNPDLHVGIPHWLVGSAELALAEGPPERAAQLFGAVVAMCEAAGISLSPDGLEHFDRVAAALREILGLEAFEAAWAAGRSMTEEEAVAYALEEGTHKR